MRPEEQAEAARLARGSLSAMADWGSERLDLMVDASTVLALLDESDRSPPATLSRFGQVVFQCVARQHRESAPPPQSVFAPLNALDVSERHELLQYADGFIAPELAPFLADLLAEANLLPQYTRLPALLAQLDADRCNRLVERVGDATGHRGDFWINTVIEALLSAIDTRLTAPQTVLAAWNEIAAGDPVSLGIEAWHAARLRLAARRSPLGALELLDEAVDEAGAIELAEGLTSVIARAVAVDREAVWRYLLEKPFTLPHRAVVLRDLCFDGTFAAREEQFFQFLLEGLTNPGNYRDRQPMAIWETTLSLLGLAASVGRTDLAVRTVEISGPPCWAVFVSTWPSARRRALRWQRWETAFWEQVEPAISRAGVGRAAIELPYTPYIVELPPQILAAMWKVKTLPLPQIPWWSAWDGVVP